MVSVEDIFHCHFLHMITYCKWYDLEEEKYLFDEYQDLNKIKVKDKMENGYWIYREGDPPHGSVYFPSFSAPLSKSVSFFVFKSYITIDQEKKIVLEWQDDTDAVWAREDHVEFRAKAFPFLFLNHTLQLMVLP